MEAPSKEVALKFPRGTGTIKIRIFEANRIGVFGDFKYQGAAIALQAGNEVFWREKTNDEPAGWHFNCGLHVKRTDVVERMYGDKVSWSARDAIQAAIIAALVANVTDEDRKQGKRYDIRRKIKDLQGVVFKLKDEIKNKELEIKSLEESLT